MSEKWEKVALGDVMTLQRGHDLPSHSREHGEIPIVSSSGITDFHNEAKANPPGVVTGRYGTIGEVFYIDQPYWPLNTALYVKDFKGNNAKFISYVLESLNLKEMNAAGAVPGINRNHLHKLKLLFPTSRTIQDRIVALVSSYEDLIENNLKRIKLLEEMALITYEEWFVRMKFPGHEIAAFDEKTGLPEGWSTRNLGHYIEHEIGGGWGEEEASKEFSETAYVIRGTDFNGLSTGNRQNVPLRWHKKSNLASRKLASGDIIFEVSGGSQNEGVAKTVLMTEELLSLFDEDVMCASFCKLARPKSTKVGHYLFYFLRFLRKIKASEVFEIRSASNIVNYNWTAFLKFQEVNFPSNSLLDDFYVISENSTKQISVLAKQINLLKEARDILLPRLMTGMIDIEQVELPEAMLKRLEEQEDKMATAV
ncbi:restriction endonuclease subunit S [Motilimonas pumila]|uniref:Restriction endonuclease subunit S n=1 Tax=Motilimonas pumila TaxID=2303987 RepID=A0A418YJ00_9GAMM|nr:restriction endonuclease subunit S [Motilimonas pumila]RJG50587.1 restriction endonuclease subunit S [Motilimonas pumila]